MLGNVKIGVFGVVVKFAKLTIFGCGAVKTFAEETRLRQYKRLLCFELLQQRSLEDLLMPNSCSLRRGICFDRPQGKGNRTRRSFQLETCLEDS